MAMLVQSRSPRAFAEYLQDQVSRSVNSKRKDWPHLPVHSNLGFAFNEYQDYVEQAGAERLVKLYGAVQRKESNVSV